MKPGVIILVAASIAASVAASSDVALAQGAADQERTLKRDVEQRFDVLPLREGVVLRPKRANAGVRSIEITNGSIGIDGKAVTGAELRTALGADADIVLRLSYLDAEARQRMFGGGASAAPPGSAPSAAFEPPAPPERAERPERSDRDVVRDALRESFRARHSGGSNRVRFGGPIHVEDGEIVDGDAVVFGGPLRIDGEVTGDAVAFGGSLTLGPKAYVHHDVVVFGGHLERDPSARVDGSVVDTAAFRGGDQTGRTHLAWFRRTWMPWDVGAASGFSSFLALIMSLSRILVLSALVSLVLLLGHDYVLRAGVRASAEPVASGAIGVLAQLLFIPLLVLTILILVVTIIGIPLLLLVPFAVLALGIIGLVGFTAVASNVGHLVLERLHWRERNAYVTAIAGIALLLSPVIVGRVVGLAGGLLAPLSAALMFIGFVAEYLAWTVGFGAVALLRFRRTPPAEPTAATA
jgi:hypothetical protein